MQFFPIFLKFEMQGYTSDKEEEVRWPVTPELLNAHARQLTSGLAHFRLASYGKISLMSNIEADQNYRSNISKTVTDTMLRSIDVK